MKNNSVRSSISKSFLDAIQKEDWSKINEFAPGSIDIETASIALNTSESWSVVEYLCVHQNPDRASVEKVLKLAASKEKYHLVDVITNLTGDNRPSYEAIEEALIAAAVNNAYAGTIECFFGPNKPYTLTQESVSKALDAARSWSVIKYLCAYQNPDRASVEKVLKLASSEGMNELVRIIITRFNPSADAILSAIDEARKENKTALIPYLIGKEKEKRFDSCIQFIYDSWKNKTGAFSHLSYERIVEIMHSSTKDLYPDYAAKVTAFFDKLENKSSDAIMRFNNPVFGNANNSSYQNNSNNNAQQLEGTQLGM